MPFEIFVLVALVIFFASFTQGITGFGFALVSVPLISMIIDVKYAVSIAAICGLVVNIYLIFKLKNHIHYFELKELIISAVAGIPIGSAIVIYTDQDILKILLGIVVLLFVFLSATKIIKQINLKKEWGYIFGFFSGLLGGAFNTNGPPILIFFYLKGYDKFKQKASITGFFIITSVTIVITHLVTGLSTEAIWLDALKLIPVIMIGIVLGHSIFHKISTKFYNRLILLGLFVVGIVLMIN
jgi:uncharacterized protein